MAKYHANNESQIEILRHRIQALVNRKNELVQNLTYEILETEQKISVLRDELKDMEQSLEELREKREIEETDCYKEITKLHNQIIDLTGYQ